MEAYELWRSLMYCVGVFVTCNAGGAGLRWAASALARRRAEDAPPKRGQTFAEMMRQVDAHKADYPPDETEADEPDGTDGSPAPETERVTPEELAAAYQRADAVPNDGPTY